jgi:hypothetical protein
MIIGIDISKKTFDIAFFKDDHWLLKSVQNFPESWGKER